MESLSASTDAELLRAWSTGRCETSFRALVAKYLGLVHGLALRHTGNGALADEISQNVFTRLAARAAGITSQPTLAPWLHHCAWCETATALRRESTRRRHMNAYADHLRTSQESGPPGTLHKALPHLDDALRALRGDDQRIVLMRFYEGRGLRDIAAALGKTEAAVRKQGQRALEKMALRLKRQGIAVSAAALATGLGAVLSQPASAAAVTVISTTAAAAAGAKLTLLNQVLTLMNAKTRTALLTAACMTLPLAWQWQRASAMEDQLARNTKDTAALKARLGLSDARNGSPLGLGSRSAGAAPGSLQGTSSASDWELALKTSDPLQRSQRLATLMASLTAESAPQVAELFKRLRQENNGSQYEVEHRHFLRAWGRLDGRAALANCFGADGKPSSSSESMAALAGWAQSSPESARAWLEQTEAGDVRTDLAFGLIDGWSLTDFDAASAFASSQPRSTMRDQFRSLFIQRALAAGGVPEAQRWFTDIPVDEHNVLYKERAFDELVSAMMQRDPAGAAEWITRMGRQKFMNGNGIPEVAAGLAASSPGEALRWLESLGMGEGSAINKTSQGYARVLDAWSQKDPAAAGSWLEEHAGHPAYDGMAASLAGRVAATDGPAGLDWAATIQDPDQRASARDNAARAILRSQGESGKSLLASSGFSANEISKLDNQSYQILTSLSALDGESSAQLMLEQASSEYRLRQARLQELDAIVTKTSLLSVQTEEAARNAALQDRLKADLTLAGSVDTGGLQSSAGNSQLVLPSVSASNPLFRQAHPNGTTANCADCHK